MHFLTWIERKWKEDYEFFDWSQNWSEFEIEKLGFQSGKFWDKIDYTAVVFVYCVREFCIYIFQKQWSGFDLKAEIIFHKNK